MKPKILITGSTGFIGSNIINLLLKNNLYIYDILRNKNKTNLNVNKLKKNPNYFPIFYKKIYDLEKKIKKLKIDIVINCATYYSTENDIKTIQNLINTNIVFCCAILEVLKKKITKFINFGSMMEYSKGENFSPKNFYAITKNSFQNIERFYKSNNKWIKFYDLKLYETYGDKDKRKKIIPTIIKNYLQNKKVKIVSRKLKMNFVHIESLMKIIHMIIFGKVKEGEYCIKNDKFTNIKNLINLLNKNLKNKIQTQFLSSDTFYNNNKKLKRFPSWRDEKNLKNFLLTKLQK
jgi:nucleoside-diphosphate-sugar epimerase